MSSYSTLKKLAVLPQITFTLNVELKGKVYQGAVLKTIFSPKHKTI